MTGSRQSIPNWVKARVLEAWDHEPSSEPHFVYCYHCLEEGEARFPVVGAIQLPAGFEWDHLIPVSRGGTNDPDNIVVSCRSCNRSKGDRLHWIGPIERWRREHHPEDFAV